MSRRIGLLGGSFNPPHLGHLAMAQHAYDKLKLDEVWLLITPQNPEKPLSAAPFEHRFKMCELLTQQHVWLKPSTLEQESGARDTYATVDYIQQKFPDDKFFWLMGSDNLKSFHEWEFEQAGITYKDIFAQLPIIIYARDTLAEAAARQSVTLQNFAAAEYSYTQLESLPAWHLVVDFDHPASSTAVRANDHDHLPMAVSDYIKSHSLYQE